MRPASPSYWASIVPLVELLETVNRKLSSVLSKMTRATRRSILEALATAKTIEPERFAAFARHKRVRDKRPALRKALRCYPTDRRSTWRAGAVCVPGCAERGQTAFRPHQQRQQAHSQGLGAAAARITRKRTFFTTFLYGISSRAGLGFEVRLTAKTTPGPS